MARWLQGYVGVEQLIDVEHTALGGAPHQDLELAAVVGGAG